MNTAPPPKKIEYAIVCDDVRREDNGKLIIIGAYASDILIPSRSPNLRLTILIAVRSEIKHQSLVKIRVMQDGKQIFEMKEELEIFVAAQDISSIVIAAIPIAAEIGKTLDFQVRFDQGRFRSACKLNVREKAS